jgi:hypothetical protein
VTAASSRFRFTLYVVGNEANSLLAQENLRHICAECLQDGSGAVKIVDVLKDFEAAVEDNVLVTPTLIVEGPRGRSVIVGNLSNIDRVLLTLGFN